MKQIESFGQIIFEYNTGPVPPPFCHKYKIAISKSNHETFHVDLILKYYDREELSDEEIFEEGFTKKDDYEWKGDFPIVWGQEIEKKLSSTNWKKMPSPRPDGTEFSIKKVNNDQSEILNSSSSRAWEVFVQEIIQAVFELSKKEAPLLLGFISKNSKLEESKVDFEFSFATREVKVNSGGKGENSISWAEGQKLLKYIFSIDYLPEKSMDKIPKKPGNFLNPGDGYWYELALHEHANENSRTQIVKLAETLKSYGR